MAVNEAGEHGFFLVVNLVERGSLDLYYCFLCSDGGDPMALYQLASKVGCHCHRQGCGTDKRKSAIAIAHQCFLIGCRHIILQRITLFGRMLADGVDKRRLASVQLSSSEDHLEDVPEIGHELSRVTVFCYQVNNFPCISVPIIPLILKDGADSCEWSAKMGHL